MGRDRPTLRPIDLARLAGVSTQQIRNYLDDGILPPAPRTPTGYRRLDHRHRQALLTYRALVPGYGGATARAIMQAVHSGDVAEALILIDAAHAAAHDQRRALRETADALETIAGQTPDTPTAPRTGLRIGEAAAHLRIRASALRLWESAGLLAPRRDPATGHRRYGPADIRDARMIHLLRQARYRLPQIRPIIEDLRRTGGTDALRAAIAQRQADLTRRATAMLAGAAHLHHYLAVNDSSPAGVNSP